MFDIILGNPPYGEILKKDIPIQHKHYFQSGEYYATYLLFILIAVENLKIGGKLLFLVPNKWLSMISITSFREKLFKLGKLNFIEVFDQPKEWTKNHIQVGQVSIFEFEKGKEKHSDSIFIINNRIPNVNCELDNSILEKFFKKSKSFLTYKIINGTLAHTKKYENVVHTNTVFNRDYINYFGIKQHGFVKQSKKYEKEFEEIILNAKQNNNKFLCFPNFTNRPFKINKNPISPIVICDPMLLSNVYCCISTNNPEKLLKYLNANLIRYVSKMFYSDKTFTKSLDNLIPDILNDLTHEVNEQEINELFELNEQEINHINEVVKSYGKCT